MKTPCVWPQCDCDEACPPAPTTVIAPTPVFEVIEGENDDDAYERFIAANGGYEGEHPVHTVAAWEEEVVGGWTRMGYWDWAYAEAQE